MQSETEYVAATADELYTELDCSVKLAQFFWKQIPFVHVLLDDAHAVVALQKSELTLQPLYDEKRSDRTLVPLLLTAVAFVSAAVEAVPAVSHTTVTFAKVDALTEDDTVK